MIFSSASQLYFHHPGYRRIFYSIYTRGRGGGTLRMSSATDIPAKVEEIKAGKIGFEIIFPDDSSDKDIGQEKFILFAFEHRKARQRPDLIIRFSPSAAPTGVHTEITASGSLLLYDGLIPFGDDTLDSRPIVLPTL